MADPFAPKFLSLIQIQNNIGLNFSDGLNFVTCEHSLTVVLPLLVTYLLLLHIEVIDDDTNEEVEGEK